MLLSRLLHFLIIFSFLMGIGVKSDGQKRTNNADFTAEVVTVLTRDLKVPHLIQIPIRISHALLRKTIALKPFSNRNKNLKQKISKVSEKKLILGCQLLIINLTPRSPFHTEDGGDTRDESQFEELKALMNKTMKRMLQIKKEILELKK